MINFFRKIRRQLLVEKHFSKYILYALGEILLVVVGILVALQINGWKEQQNQKQLQRVYLNRMVNDLDHDLANIDIVHATINENQTVISNFIKTVNSTQNEDSLLKSMTAYFEKGWIISEFVPSMNTYTDLSQTGNMKVIGNTGLVNDIIAYYGYIAQLENSNNVNKNWITPIDQAVAKETAAFEIDPNTSKLFSNNDQSAAIKNLLLHKALMERNAAGHFWINSSLNGNLQAIKSLTEDLILAIKNELKFLGES